MPAAAVIPAQLVYAKVVASKSLVVGFWERQIKWRVGLPARVCAARALLCTFRLWAGAINLAPTSHENVSCEKIRVFKAGKFHLLNIAAWDNEI